MEDINWLLVVLFAVVILTAVYETVRHKLTKDPNRCDYCGRKAVSFYEGEGGWKKSTTACKSVRCNLYAARDSGGVSRFEND